MKQEYRASSVKYNACINRIIASHLLLQGLLFTHHLSASLILKSQIRIRTRVTDDENCVCLSVRVSTLSRKCQNLVATGGIQCGQGRTTLLFSQNARIGMIKINSGIINKEIRRAKAPNQNPTQESGGHGIETLPAPSCPIWT